MHLILAVISFAATVFAASAARLYNTGRNLVYIETINFASPNTFTSTSWQPVSSLTRTINVDRPLAAAMIDYTIPLVGVEQDRARIRLRVNGQFYTDATIYCGGSADNSHRKQIHLDAVIPNVQPGQLLIEILAQTQGNPLKIPDFVNDGVPVFASLSMVGLVGPTAPPLVPVNDLPPCDGQ